jgi:hypothetical protein
MDGNQDELHGLSRGKAGWAFRDRPEDDGTIQRGGVRVAGLLIAWA